MSRKKRKYQSRKIRTFLLFLFLACVIWVLTKFSKEVSGSMSAQLIYQKLPDSTVLAENNSASITFDVTGTGYDFLLYKVKPPQVRIDVSQYYQEGNDVARVDNSQLIRLIALALDGKKGIRNLSTNQLIISLDRIESKRVRVSPRLELTFEEGFRAVALPVVTPDLVLLSGPNEALARIDSMVTDVLNRQNVDSDIEAILPLGKDLPATVSVSPGEVALSLEVEEFSPKELLIPVELLNAPAELRLKLVPEAVRLSFNVPISRFNEAVADDFRMVCDFEKRDRDDNFLLPELIESPEYVQNIVFSHNKIDYLIFKKDEN